MPYRLTHCESVIVKWNFKSLIMKRTIDRNIFIVVIISFILAQGLDQHFKILLLD